MTKCDIFNYFKARPQIIRLAVMMYVRYALSLRNVEDLLHERGIDISHETERVLVEPLWFVVCRRGPQEKGQPDARIFKLAVALGRGVREDQRREALSLAGCRSQRGSPGKLFHKAPGSQCSLEIPQQNHETPWSRTYLRHRQATFLRCGNEGHWQRGQTVNWSLAQQLGQ